jgi:hypothetical protein
MREDGSDDECKQLDEYEGGIKAGGLAYVKYLVSKGRYALSPKAYGQHAEGYYELEDLENSICCGKVHKTEKDERKECLGNKKYVIVGPDTHGYEFYSVGKIKPSDDGHIYYIITAHSRGANYV